MALLDIPPDKRAEEGDTVATISTVVIKCDKCGRELQYGNFCKVTHRNFAAGKLSVLFPNWHSPREYDLCFKCNRQLEDWFDNPTDEQGKATEEKDE